MKKLSLIIALTTIMFMNMANAQSLQKRYEQNPFTLVYDGAINKNEKGKVNIHPVTYKLILLPMFIHLPIMTLQKKLPPGRQGIRQ